MRIPSDWIAVLPIAAIEQHGPHLPVGVDALIAEAMVERCAAALPEGSPGHLPAGAAGVQVQRTYRFSGHADARLGHRDPVLAADRGKRRARRAAQDDHRHQPWRQRPPDGDRCAGVADDPRDGGRHDLLDAAGEDAGLRLPRGADGRHPWRAVGDLDDAGALPRACARRPRGGFRQCADRAAAGLYAKLGFHMADANLGWLSQDLNPKGTVGDASSATAALGAADIAGRWRASSHWSRTWPGTVRRSPSDAAKRRSGPKKATLINTTCTLNRT
jgi:creatinine amidohydrolase